MGGRVAVFRRPRAGVRLHRPRRLGAGLLALHRRDAGRRQTRRRHRLPLSTDRAAAELGDRPRKRPGFRKPIQQIRPPLLCTRTHRSAYRTWRRETAAQRLTVVVTQVIASVTAARELSVWSSMSKPCWPSGTSITSTTTR